MKKYSYFLLIISLLYVGDLFGQNAPFTINRNNKVSLKLTSEIIPPDIAAFQKRNMFPVSLFTGKVNVDIPIYTINSGDISIPISISYNTGGIKVDEKASSVGLGWSLNAGGNIYRKVNDLPDNQISISTIIDSDWDVSGNYETALQTEGYNRRNDRKKSHLLQWASLVQAGLVNAFCIEYVGDISNPPSFVFDLDYPNGTNGGGEYKDFSPDIFIANAPGLSAKFTALRANNNYLQTFSDATFIGKTIDNNGVKISNISLINMQLDGFGFSEIPGNREDQFATQYTPIRDFNSFTLVNTKGIKYSFSNPDLTESFIAPIDWDDSKYDGQTGIIPVSGRVLIGRNNYSKTINTWNLEKIQDNNNKTVLFNYEVYSHNTALVNRYVETFTGNKYLGFDAVTPDSNECIFVINPNFFQFGNNRELYKGGINNFEKAPVLHRLTDIVFDEGKVEFSYSARLDLPDEKKLDKITIYDYLGNIIKIVKLNYEYFNAGCTPDPLLGTVPPDCYRLKLINIIELNPTNLAESTNRYSFEYEENINLPVRGSVQQDFLGFYNNNGVEGLGNSYTKPILYFYKNNYKNSILPFRLTNRNPDKIITGDLDLTSNMYAEANILKKITYPTGGITQFEYENNKFKFSGNEYVSGGLRIKKQIINDGNKTRQIEYKYVDCNGQSSGRINNIPVFGYPRIMLGSDVSSFYVYDSNKTNIELTQNSFVTYSQVTEKEVGKGYTVYQFYSNIEYPHESNLRQSTYGYNYNVPLNSGDYMANYCFACSDRLIKNSAFATNYHLEKNYLRGKEKQIKVYNENNELLVTKEYEYQSKDFNVIELNSTKRIGNTFYSPTNRKLGINMTSQFKYARNLLGSEIIKQYFNGQEMIITKNFTYDNNYPFMIQKIVNDNNGNIYKSNIYYTFSSEVNSEPYVNNLLANNIYIPVKYENYLNKKLLSTKKYTFNDFGVPTTFDYDGIPIFGYEMIKANSLYESKGLQTLENNTIIDYFDNKGNILQHHSKDNIYTSYIWGYNKKYMVAKVVGKKLIDIPQNLINEIETTVNQNMLLLKLQELRGLPGFDNALISTYTYKPLVGLTSITDPKGDTQYYHYDNFNRLQYVKDKDGYILKENEYHYRSN